MHGFKTYQPYILNTDILSKLNLKISQDKSVLELPFFKVVENIFTRAENKKINVGDIELGGLEITIEDQAITITGEFYLLAILHTIFRVGSDDSYCGSWKWYFLEEDYVQEDPTVQFDIFLYVMEKR